MSRSSSVIRSRARSNVHRVCAAVALAAAACHHAPPPAHVAIPKPGVTLTMYANPDEAFTLIDERRTVEVRDGTLTLDHLDAGLALPSLEVLPLTEGRDALVIGTCTHAP